MRGGSGTRNPAAADGRRIGVARALLSDPWCIGALAAGIVLRSLFLTSPGYVPDVMFWKSHLTYATTFGIQNVYSLDTPLQPYPPVLLYILWGIGHLYTAIWPAARDTPLLTALVKLPAVLGDLIAAFLLARYALRHGRGDSLSPARAAALLALNPALVWVSSFWGQVDVLHGGIAAGAFGAALGGSSATAGLLLSLGVFTKPQGLIVLPIVVAAMWVCCRAKGLVRALAAGLVLALLIVLPFVVAGYARQLIQIYTGAANLYPYLSVNAFNPWWILTVLGGGGRHSFLRDDEAFLGGLTLRALGIAAFLAASGWIVWRCVRDARAASLASSRAWRLLTLQWLAFFLLPTQVHERYLVPALLSMAPAVVLEPRWMRLYAVLSLCIALNVAYVLPGNSIVWAITRIVTGDGIAVAAVLTGVAGILVAAELREGRDARVP